MKLGRRAADGRPHHGNRIVGNGATASGMGETDRTAALTPPVRKTFSE